MRHALVAAQRFVAVTAAAVCSAQDGPYHVGQGDLRSAARADGTTSRSIRRRTASTSATRPTSSSSIRRPDKVVGDIPDTPGVHGFAIAADLGRGFSSNGRENKVGIIDLKTLKLDSEGRHRREPGRDPLRAGDARRSTR